MTTPPNPYEGLRSLFQQHPNGAQFGFVPVTKNPTNGLAIPFFAAQSLEDKRAAFQAMPPHLQQQIAKMERINAEQMALMENPAHVPTFAQMPPTTATSPHPSTAQKTGDAATQAGVKRPKPKPAKPKHGHEFNTRKFHVRLNSAYGELGENRIYKTKKLTKQTWQRLEQIYTKYLDRVDYPNGNLHLEDMFFYQSADSGARFFQVTYTKDGYMEKKLILVDGDDLDEIRALRAEYHLLVRDEPKQREFKRLHYSPEGLQSNLHFAPRPSGPSESPILSMMRDEAIEKGQKQAKSYSATVTHPLLPHEMTADQQRELVERPIRLGHSEIEFVEESDWTTMSRSQYLFSESPHEVRAYYGVSPRTGNHPSEFNHPEVARLARLQPLHYCLNARAGALHGKKSVEVQEHPSLVVFSKHETYGYRFASITQKSLSIPVMQEDQADHNCSVILEAILEQAAKYHEARLGFKETPLKQVKIREPIIAEGIRPGPLSEDKLREIRLSVFIRSMAMLLVNSNDRVRAPKVQLEFEYTPLEDEESVPEFVQNLSNQQSCISAEILGREISEEGEPLLNMKDLVDLFYLNLLDQFPDPEEMRARRDSLFSNPSSTSSSRDSLRRGSDASETAHAVPSRRVSVSSQEEPFLQGYLSDGDL